MSNGPWSPHHKYAPGLDAKTNGLIDKILLQWRKAGIGVMRDRGGKR